MDIYSEVQEMSTSLHEHIKLPPEDNKTKLKDLSASTSTLDKGLSGNMENEQGKKRRSASPAISNKEFKKSKLEKEDSQDGYSGSPSGLFNRYPTEEIEDESYEEIAKQYKKFSNAPKFNLNSEELFCICRKPDYGGELMISCDNCDEWFHFKCMKLNEDHSKLIAKFYCKFCRWKGISSTKWKRKCRLDWCWEPIRADSKSKYCCDEHGVSFIKENLLRKTGINDLNPTDIKSIFNYCISSGNSYKNLVQLGSDFPELPEISSLKEDGSDISQLPGDLENSLTKINSNLDRINSITDLCKLKSDYLLKIKEKIKIINERLQASYQDEEQVEKCEESLKSKRSTKESKSKKSKKFDLCCYDKSLNQGIQTDVQSKNAFEKFINSADIYSDYKEQIDSLISFYRDNMDDIDSNSLFNNSMCIQDKRKCPRHNGWWNLINDELVKRFNELSLTAKKLEDEKLMILRNYSIKIYELRT